MQTCAFGKRWKWNHVERNFSCSIHAANGYYSCKGTAWSGAGVIFIYRGDDWLPLPVQQRGHAARISAGMKQIIDAGLSVHPDFHDIQGSLWIYSFKTIGCLCHTIPPYFFDSPSEYLSGEQERFAFIMASAARGVKLYFSEHAVQDHKTVLSHFMITGRRAADRLCGGIKERPG